MTAREAELTALVEAAQKESQVLREENRLLRQKLDLLIRRMFGAKSEALDPGQLELLLTGLEGPAPGKSEASSVVATGDTLEAAPARHRWPCRRREQAPRVPADLPVIEQVLDPEPVLADPEQWRCIGQEVTDQLDYEPGRFVCRRLIRRKFVSRRRPEAPPITAPLALLQDRSLAAPGLLARIIVGKYCEHLPLYRQEQIFALRHGVKVPRQTMARWLTMVAGCLRPLYREIRTTVMDGGYVQIDETVVKYLSPGHGKTRQG